MAKQCQSCGMPLFTKKAGDCRGREENGTKSEKWCTLCYDNGSFRTSLSLDEMRKIVDDALIENGSGRIMRWLAQNQLPRLERWKN